MKKSWVAAITALSFTLVVGGAAYYINSVYLPAKQLEAANALRTNALAQAEEGTNYDYTIKVGETAASNTEKFSESSSVTVTTDETTGDVWITRDWLNDGSSRVSSEPPTLEDTGRAEANIGSGGTNIVGSDGVYHGEQPITPPPATTKPTTEQTKPSGSSGSTSGTETGTNGQTRVVDGQQQIWINGWGWVPVGSGSRSEASKGTNTELSGVQVGKM